MKKNNELNSSQQVILTRFNYKEIETFHPNRKSEFLLGRLCAFKAHELHCGTELLSLPISSKRSPEWPINVIGSITHNQFWVGAAVSKSHSLIGIGIDFEVMGRTKLELARYIRSPKDLKIHESFSENELLTLIFSAKESLYKALHPVAKCFFGFEAAAVKEINIHNGTFKIELISNISPNFGPLGRFQFEGRFKIEEESCLTVLEILH